jgi:hypothetical protein
MRGSDRPASGRSRRHAPRSVHTGPGSVTVRFGGPVHGQPTVAALAGNV